MLKGEIDILSSVALRKCKMKQIFSGRNIRDTTYTLSTIDSMIKDGLIQEGKFGIYELTLSGIQALLKYSKNTDILDKKTRSKLQSQYLKSTRNKKQLSGSRGQSIEGVKRIKKDGNPNYYKDKNIIKSPAYT
jgi:predicted transcriptional regulator